MKNIFGQPMRNELHFQYATYIEQEAWFKSQVQ
jgi:hypothetical protein